MVTIINSKTLSNMLPPLDPQVLMSIEICKREREFEAMFNKFATWLGVFAILYVIFRCYWQ